MYCLCEPGEDCKQWQEKRALRRGNKTRSPTPTAISKTYADTTKTGGDRKKLALSQTLQTALMTHTGMSEDHFQKIWDEACDESGN